MKLALTFPVNRTRRRKLALWSARNCRREAERPQINPDRAADLLSWADALDTALARRKPYSKDAAPINYNPSPSKP